MITTKCCNNSEQVRFENLLKEGCGYKSGKKLIPDIQIQIQLGLVFRRF